MTKRPTLIRSLLLLMLVVVPLQAQTVFACSMMGTIAVSDCCCDDPVIDSGCVTSSCSGCCEQSVEVSVDQDALSDNPVVKPVEIRSSLDPPPVLLFSFELHPHPVVVSTDVDYLRSLIPGHSGSEIYLYTQRLRL